MNWKDRSRVCLKARKNYDIATSLKPQLVPESAVAGSEDLHEKTRDLQQRREAARRQQGVGNIAICSREAKIKRAWRGGEREEGPCATRNRKTSRTRRTGSPMKISGYVIRSRIHAIAVVAQQKNSRAVQYNSQ